MSHLFLASWISPQFRLDRASWCLSNISTNRLGSDVWIFTESFGIIWCRYLRSCKGHTDQQVYSLREMKWSNVIGLRSECWYAFAAFATCASEWAGYNVMLFIISRSKRKEEAKEAMGLTVWSLISGIFSNRQLLRGMENGSKAAKRKLASQTIVFSS